MQRSETKKVALGIFRLRPAGGLERHALRLASELLARGISVTFYTTDPGEAVPEGAGVVMLPRSGFTNHGALAAFSRSLAAATANGDELVVGFQKLAGLDVLFCADWCFADRPANLWTRLNPRHRAMCALERACFAPSAATRILALSQPQLDAFVAVYDTPRSRTAVLPPTVDPRYAATMPDAARRASARTAYGLAKETVAWLWTGLQPRVKGLDRVTAALAKRPEAVLFVVGVDPAHRALAALLRQARGVGLERRIRLLGVVSDAELQALFTACDLLVHPARLDVTGTVILEAMANGLPVVTTANCGYSVHVATAQAGSVIPPPFEQSALDHALAAADAAMRARWSENALAYARNPLLYSGIAKAADVIEQALGGRRRADIRQTTSPASGCQRTE